MSSMRFAGRVVREAAAPGAEHVLGHLETGAGLAESHAHRGQVVDDDREVLVGVRCALTL